MTGAQTVDSQLDMVWQASNTPPRHQVGVEIDDSSMQHEYPAEAAVSN